MSTKISSILSTKNFYENILSSQVMLPTSMVVLCMLNISLSSSIFNLIEGFAKTGIIGGIVAIMAATFLNLVSSNCLIVAIARANAFTKSKEVYTGNLTLMSDYFWGDNS